MRIGVDLDDVLFDTNSSIALFHNQHYGTSYRREDVRSWHLENLWGCTVDEAVQRVNQWLDSSHHDELEPFAGAQVAVAHLAQDHTLPIISSRPKRVQERTENLVRRHFWSSFAGVHLTDQFGRERRSKGDVCRELGITHLIEDSPTHARAALEAGVTVLLFDSPWNREPISDDIIRIYSWGEAVRYINALS